MTDPTTTPSAPVKGGPRRRKWMTGAVLAATFLAGGLTLAGLAASAQEVGMHAMHMMGGMGHGDMHDMGQMTRALDEVGASPDQKARMETIVHAGFKPMMDVHHDLHDSLSRMHALLAAPTIDRDALEQIRAGEIARIDAASRTMTRAIGDAAEVLRPDQRARLAAMMADHHHPS
jgi:protein CpxP